MTRRSIGFNAALAAFLVVLMGVTAALAEGGAVQAPTPGTGGPVTNLPMPRFVSIRASKTNVRRGPSLTHRIDWVYRRKDLPLQITAEYGHWRQVRDNDGIGGWVHYSMLSGARTVLVQDDRLELYNKPDPASGVAAIVERGVVARLGRCIPEWCRITAESYRGWVHRTALWGVGAQEQRD